MPQNAPGSKIGWPPWALEGLKLSKCKQLFTKIGVSNESKNTYIIHVKIKEVIEMTEQQVFEVLKNEYRIKFITNPKVEHFCEAKSKDFSFIFVTNECTMMYRYFYNDPIKGQQTSGWNTVNIKNFSKENLMKLIDNVDSNIWCK